MKRIMPEPGSEEELFQAKQKALQLLEFRDRSRRELKDKLLGAGFTENAAECAIAYAESFGYINDHRFASNYIFGHMHDRSREKILSVLQQKGISREIALAAWEETVAREDVDERGLLRKAVEKKVEENTRLRKKELRSLYGYLQRRGFRYEDIGPVLREMNITLEKDLF